MRIYLPAVPSELASGAGSLLGHAVTGRLGIAAPDEDDEGLEMIALLAAADDSVRRLTELAGSDERPLRVVVAADVPDGEVSLEDGGLPTLVRLRRPVTRDEIRAIHVDEQSAADEVAAAAAGDDDAFERVAELDLLWYDPSERDTILGG